jgi:hypothetical protein
MSGSRAVRPTIAKMGYPPSVASQARRRALCSARDRSVRFRVLRFQSRVRTGKEERLMVVG